MVRHAKHEDLSQVTALLAAFNLPTLGVVEHLDSFVVVEANGRVVGTGGLEFYSRTTLLRSVAVAHSHQRRGFAAAICDHLELMAARRGVEHVYILTETAEEFFAKRGYSTTPRAEAPRDIATSEEFATICPQSAVLMRRLACVSPGRPARYKSAP